MSTSAAHRCSQMVGVMDFQGMSRINGKNKEHSTRIANPGCYAIGAIALLQPLLKTKKLISEEHGIAITGLSGYSGGRESIN